MVPWYFASRLTGRAGQRAGAALALRKRRRRMLFAVRAVRPCPGAEELVVPPEPPQSPMIRVHVARRRSGPQVARADRLRARLAGTRL